LVRTTQKEKPGLTELGGRWSLFPKEERKEGGIPSNGDEWSQKKALIRRETNEGGKSLDTFEGAMRKRTDRRGDVTQLVNQRVEMEKEPEFKP